MPELSKIVAVMLLGVAVGTLQSTPALALVQTHSPRQHSAACHSDSETPAPAPANFDCCATGHDAALPGNGFLLHPPAAVAVGPEIEGFAITRSAAARPVLFSDRHGPPGITSLRI